MWILGQAASALLLLYGAYLAIRYVLPPSEKKKEEPAPEGRLQGDA